MKILIACEESQRVCIEFRRKGHEAYSCDIIDCSGGHPEWHIKQDVIPLLNGNCTFKTVDGIEHSISGKWDMIIGHPPCTYLSSAGSSCLFHSNHTIKNTERCRKGILAKDFFMTILNADCDRIIVENPAPIKFFNLPQYNQIIEPYMFGDPWKKRTCLWIKGVPLLRPTHIVEPTSCWVETNGRTCRTKLRGAKGARTAKERSKTFPGIARAMADQWG